MREVEVKILEIDLEEIRKKLLALGAEKIFDGELHVVAFDYPDERLHTAGQILRVRKVGDKVELCFKDKKEASKFKVREETEVTTSGFKDTVAILEKAGLKIFYQGEKRRESYKIGPVRFEIDYYAGIPPFLEIEAPTEEQVVEWVEKLGYQMEQTTSMNGRDVKEYYENKK
jgi:adenylate cyclase class 2